MTYPRPEHYVRPRAKVSKKWWDAPEKLTPAERKEFEKYKKACKVIGERLLAWVTSARASCVPASNKKEQVKRIEGIASELLGAVRRAIHSAPIANDVWQAYVGLYRATESIRAAVETVSALPVQHQYFREEVAVLMRSISDLAPPLVHPTDAEAVFCKDSTLHSFQKRQRGRLKVVRAEIVRQALTVWLHRFQTLPPSTPDGVFHDVLGLACEYLGMEKKDWPGHVIIREEVAQLRASGKNQQSPHPEVLRYYPGQA